MFDRLYNVLSMTFWNWAGISVSPKNPVLNLYLPVACPPIIIKLHKLHCFDFFYLMVAGYTDSVGLVLKIGLPLRQTIE